MVALITSLFRRMTTHSTTDMGERDTEHGQNAPLLGLGIDILVMIVDMLPASDIKSLCLVNSYLNKTARYGLHHNIRLDLLDEDFRTPKQRVSRLALNGLSHAARPADEDLRKAQQRLSRLENDGLLPAVRSLEVSGISRRLNRIANVHGKARAWNQRELDKRLDLLCRSLPQMTGLKHLVWHGSAVPDEVLTTLHTCPEVKLSIISRESHEYSPLQCLQSCTNLYALDIQHTYVQAEECLLVTKPLREILLTCPNLRKLKLDISMPRSGCVVHGDPEEYHGIGFRNGEKPPPLEELILDGYPFGLLPPGPVEQAMMWGYGNYKGYPADMEEVKYWIEMFDWSQLRRLGGRPSGFSLTLMPQLSASPLEEISIECGGRGQDTIVPAFMSLPTTLKAIEVDSFPDISLACITRHCNSLQRLRIHHTERYDDSWNNEVVDHCSLCEIREHCPHIEELGLDIARDEDWPYETLDILAGFPRLHTLTLWFELGIRDNDNPTKPYVTFSAAAKLFNYIHTRNSRIRKLTVHSGAPPGFGFGYPSRGAFWPDENSATFECKLSPRDDEGPKGIFTTTCTTLGKAENNMLRSLLAQYPDGNVSLGGGVKEIEKYWSGLTSQRACKVAWEGPMPMVPIDWEFTSLPLLDDDDPDL
jgi:hypothetical protein